jgi:cysteine-rich repeat protein
LPVAVCSDGVLNLGEQCDDNNNTSGDGCNANCQSEATPFCGDGILNAGEQCDDGNQINGDTCESNCSNPTCGNGIVDLTEECDDAASNSNTSPDACRTNCEAPSCGDGVVDTNEDCDPAGALCNASCQRIPSCGDGIVDIGETCDDSNTTNGDGCDSNCQDEVVAFCGDGNLDAGEECDDSNSTNGDGCASDCTIEPPPFDVNCPQFTALNKFCVPLPNTGNQLTEVAPNGTCGAGFFKENPANGTDNSESFSVRKLFSDVILIKETNNFTSERPVMVLFLGSTKALLFDTGHVTNAVPQVIAPFLNGRPVEVLNTHLHGDHINNNNGFNVIAIDTSVNNGATNIINHCGITSANFDANHAAVCNNTNNYDPPDAQTLNDPETFKVVRVIRDGHVIDLGGHLLTVFFTPGHSKTSVTIQDTTRKVLFTGDTLYPDTDTISGGDVGIALVHPNGANLSEYFATAQFYASLESQVIAVVGAHSQGTMPARSLSAFLQIVQNRVNGGSNSATFNDPQGCSAGNFSVQGFPP